MAGKCLGQPKPSFLPPFPLISEALDHFLSLIQSRLLFRHPQEFLSTKSAQGCLPHQQLDTFYWLAAQCFYEASSILSDSPDEILRVAFLPKIDCESAGDNPSPGDL